MITLNRTSPHITLLYSTFPNVSLPHLTLPYFTLRGQIERMHRGGKRNEHMRWLGWYGVGNRGVGDMLEDLGSDGRTWENEENNGNKNKSETYERGGS